jgi:hypothetical protein
MFDTLDWTEAEDAFGTAVAGRAVGGRAVGALVGVNVGPRVGVIVGTGVSVASGIGVNVGRGVRVRVTVAWATNTSLVLQAKVPINSTATNARYLSHLDKTIRTRSPFANSDGKR